MALCRTWWKLMWGPLKLSGLGTRGRNIETPRIVLFSMFKAPSCPYWRRRKCIENYVLLVININLLALKSYFCSGRRVFLIASRAGDKSPNSNLGPALSLEISHAPKTKIIRDRRVEWIQGYSELGKYCQWGFLGCRCKEPRMKIKN